MTKKSNTPKDNDSNKFFLFIKCFFQKSLLIIKQNYKTLLFVFSFFLLNCAFFIITCYKSDVSLTSKRCIFILLLSFVITAVLCSLVFFFRYKNWKIENIFLVVGSVLGLLYLFIIPIGRTPDEPAHIYKVYSVAQGDLFNETQNGINGNYLPDNLLSLGSGTYAENGVYANILQDLAAPASESQSFHNVLGSSFIDYIPQIIGMFVGILLHLPLLVTIYLSRLCGFAFCIIVIYFCLKHIPILKKSLFFIACLPLTMQSLISVSYDGVIFCSAISLITFVLYCLYNKNFKMKIQHYIFIAVACIFLVSVKPTYFPLCLLLFFIPNECFKSKKSKLLFLALSLTAIISSILLPYFVSVSQAGSGTVDANSQLTFVLSNPIKYIGILCQNIVNMPILYMERFFVLEWLSVPSDEFYMLCTPIVFAILCAKEYLSTKVSFSKLFRWATVAGFFSIIILIFTALYLAWTTVGSGIVEGVQSRYILPILLLVPLMCLSPEHTKSSKLEYLISDVSIYCFLILLNMNMLSNILFVHI